MIGWRRVLAGLGVVAAGLLLGGCDLQGHVDVISPDEVSLDLLVSDYAFDCASSIGSGTVTLEPGPEVGGSASCQISGTMPLADLGFTDLRTGEVGEYWTFTGTLGGIAGEWPDVNLDVRFPGDVVSANQGTIQGNTLRLNPSQFTGSEIRVVARNRPGPATWVIAAAGGAVAGAVFTLAIVGLLRRSRRLREAVETAPAGVEPAVEGTARTPDPGSPPAAHDVVVRPVPVTAPVEIDHAWFATPPEPSTVADTSPDAGEPPEHSVWAPPEELQGGGR